MAVALLSLGAAGAAHAAVTAVIPGKACERIQVRRLAFSDPARPDALTVRATGPSCAAARIIVTVRDARGRTLWSESAFLGAVTDGRLPGEPAPDVTFESVIGAVETWVSVETSSDAPAWPPAFPNLAAATAATPASDRTLYDTRLSRARYEAIRAAREPMLCVPEGPESAHCIAKDPTTGRLVEVLSRGL